MKRLIIIFCAFSWLVSCDDGPVFPVTPSITFVSASLTQATQFTDEIVFTIHYEDGDGDLGYLDGQQAVQNLFLVDTRAIVPDSLRMISFSIPSLTPETRRPSIQGNIQITVLAPPHGSWFDPNIVNDEVIFDIYLRDRADHQSNVIQTDPITLLR